MCGREERTSVILRFLTTLWVWTSGWLDSLRSSSRDPFTIIILTVPRQGSFGCIAEGPSAWLTLAIFEWILISITAPKWSTWQYYWDVAKIRLDADVHVLKMDAHLLWCPDKRRSGGEVCPASRRKAYGVDSTESKSLVWWLENWITSFISPQIHRHRAFLVLD